MTFSKCYVVQHRIQGLCLGEEYEVGRDQSGKGHWNSVVKGLCAMLGSLDFIL